MINEKPSVNVSIGNYIDIVRRRLWTAVNTFVVATTIGIAATFLAVSTYQTHARILLKPIPGATVDSNNPNRSGLLSADPPDSIETQIQLLQNPTFLQRAYAKANLKLDSGISHVVVSQVGATNLIDISVEGTDPNKIALLANTMATMHLRNEESDIGVRLSNAEAYLKAESDRALSSVGIAQGRLAEYRRAHPNADPLQAPTPDYRDRDVFSMKSQLRTAELSVERLQARIADVQSRLKGMQDVVVHKISEPNTALDDANANLAKLKADRTKLLKTYGPMNPKIRALDSQISDLEDSIKLQPKEKVREVTSDNLDKRNLQSTLDQLQMQLSDAQITRDSLSASVNSMSAPTPGQSPGLTGTLDKDFLALQRDVDTTTRQYMAFHDKLQDVQIIRRAIGPPPPAQGLSEDLHQDWAVGRVAEPATPPQIPIRPQRGFLIVASVLAAIVLSLSVVFILEYFDDSLKWPEELEWYTGLSILGYSPTIDDPKSLLITKAPTYSIVAERYRLLRANVQFATVDSPLRSMLITSGIGGEGKSLVAANLAAAFALEGRRVILIDADMRKPTQHTHFEVKPSPGLSELLDGVASLRDCVQETQTPNLYVIGAGQPKGNPAEMIGSRLVDMLLNELKPYCDMVIFDAPPCLAVADASLLSAKTDATLLVVDFSRAKRHVIRQSITVLARARAKVIGAVLNRVDNQRRSSYYGYGYYYAYPSRALPEGDQHSEANGNGARAAALARLPGAPSPVDSLPDHMLGAENPPKQ